MQAKISAFFKPSSSSEFTDGANSRVGSGIEAVADKSCGEFNYRHDEGDAGSGTSPFQQKTEPMSIPSFHSKQHSSRGTKILNKKRNYAQYHLELGQSDFLLHTCSTCRLKYARGDETDEKVHKEFHMNYCHGIQFKGWHNERVLLSDESGGDRIILVLNGDSPSQRNKVDEILRFVGRDLDLSDNWLLHALCKVYLFISNQRLVGVLIAEPIKTAYRVISSSDSKNAATIATVQAKTSSLNSTNLRFGNTVFQRFTTRKCLVKMNSDSVVKYDAGAIKCDTVPVSAICGVRSIWVAPSCRRKHIATRLLDVARRSFCKGHIVELSECAFSQPTSCGQMLASRKMTDYALELDAGLLLPADLLADVLHPLPCELKREPKTFIQFGSFVEPAHNEMSFRHAGDQMYYRLQLPALDQNPVRRSFPAMARRRYGHGGLVGSRGSGGTGVFLPRAVGNGDGRGNAGCTKEKQKAQPERDQAVTYQHPSQKFLPQEWSY